MTTLAKKSGQRSASKKKTLKEHKPRTEKKTRVINSYFYIQI